MFIRESKTKNKKTGKVYVKHVLIESVRTPRGPRQRTVLTLGTLELAREQWKPLAQALEDYLYGTQGLDALCGYDLPSDLIEEIQRQQSIIREKAAIDAKKQEFNVSQCAVSEQTAEKQSVCENDDLKLFVDNTQQDFQKVDIASLSFGESRTLGPELLAFQAWNQLNFNEILQGCGFNNKEIALSAAAVWGRLIAPGSDLATWRWLRNESCLNEFFDAQISRVHKDKIYEIPDKLLAHKSKLEDALYARQNELFPGRSSVFLFDLTNFYFEGKCESNTLAKRGKSKEKRSQNALVSLALIVDQDGFPVKSKIHRGNVGEPETLEKILNDCGLLNDDLIKPTLIMDRGIATEDNVCLIKENQFPYAVIQRADKCREFKSHFEEMEGFIQIKDSKEQVIHLKNVDGKTLCCSEARQSKEDAMRTGKVKRAHDDLTKLKKSIDKGNVKDTEVIYQRLGRLKERYSGIDKLFDITTTELAQPENKKFPMRVQLSFCEKDQKDSSSALYSGCYVIDSNGMGSNPEDIWRMYMTLTRVEGAFRSMKTDLGTRPVYHQGAERTEAHLFISILAYHMLANIEYRLRAAGDPREWRTLCSMLKTHQRATISWKDENALLKHKRSSGEPEVHHKNIYDILMVTDPLTAVYY